MTADFLRRPVVSQLVMVALAAAIAAVLWWRRGAPGDVFEVPITLVTADRNDLACATDKSVGGRRCGFTAAGQPARDLKPNDVLVPVMSTDRQLWLIAGLFEQPDVVKRLEEEPPEGKPRVSLRRFVAHCRVRQLTTTEVRVRWLADGPWGDPVRAAVGVAQDCSVSE